MKRLSLIRLGLVLSGCSIALGWYFSNTIRIQTTPNPPQGIVQSDLQGSLTVLHGFTADGGSPLTQLTQTVDGSLYGLVASPLNKRSNVPGLLFQLSSTGQFSIIHQFEPFELSTIIPLTLRFNMSQDSRGVLYGETISEIFKFTPPNQVSKFLDMDDLGGTFIPKGLFQASNGYLYGSTLVGPYSFGSLFRTNSDGEVTLIHEFEQDDLETDGAIPAGPLVEVDGRIFGTTRVGGKYNGGTLFEIQTNDQLQTLHHFNRAGISFPSIMAPKPLISIGNGSGAFITIDYSGGDAGLGRIVGLIPSKRDVALHSFRGWDGAGPFELIRASDGHFYGITLEGGVFNRGTLFRLSSGSPLQVLHSFNGQDGSAPVSLIEGQDGHLYGAASEGGPFNRGTIFKYTLR